MRVEDARAGWAVVSAPRARFFAASLVCVSVLAFPSSSLQTAFVAAFKADANEGIFVFDADFGAHHMTFY
jgi:hypothetical protein